MALLSQAAIALLERLPPTFTDLRDLELDPGDRALAELRHEGCAETEVWPPPNPHRRRVRAWREHDDTIQRVVRVRLTGRGAFRLQRLRQGRRR